MALKITFVKLGTNAEGAVFGDVTLWNGATVVHKVSAFSGGGGFDPLDDGTYRIRLDIRADESSNVAKTDGSLETVFGIQKVGTHVVDANGKAWDMQWEWGSVRARLNPTGGAPDHGDFLHGKKRPKDWTHGCICDRSEKIMKYLWDLASPPAHIDVEVTGGIA
jgi:hypothetical protein